MRHVAFICATPVLASAVACRTLAAQMFLGFGGLEARAGIADPKTGGSSATFEVDLGYAFLRSYARRSASTLWLEHRSRGLWRAGGRLNEGRGRCRVRALRRLRAAAARSSAALRI